MPSIDNVPKLKLSKLLEGVTLAFPTVVTAFKLFDNVNAKPDTVILAAPCIVTVPMLVINSSVYEASENKALAFPYTYVP